MNEHVPGFSNFINEDERATGSTAPTMAFDIISKIGRMEGFKLIELNGTPSGYVAGLQYIEDPNNMYEITIRPVEIQKYFEA